MIIGAVYMRGGTGRLPVSQRIVSPAESIPPGHYPLADYVPPDTIRDMDCVPPDTIRDADGVPPSGYCPPKKLLI
jgi:hypothetical protein